MIFKLLISLAPKKVIFVRQIFQLLSKLTNLKLLKVPI